MDVVFFLNKLRDDVSPADYEEWVRRVDYPTARAVPAILDYHVVRVEGPLEGGGDAPFDYVERVVITGHEAYLSDLNELRATGFTEQWKSFVASTVALHGKVVE